jgi:hypothetical protein
MLQCWPGPWAKSAWSTHDVSVAHACTKIGHRALDARGCVVIGGAMVAQHPRCLHREKEGGEGVAPGKTKETTALHGGLSAARQPSGGGATLMLCCGGRCR